MICPVCGEQAERLPRTFDGEGVRCNNCGDYGITGSVLASEDWQWLEQSQRLDALRNAKRQTEPGNLSKITTYRL